MSYQRVQNVLYHSPAELTTTERFALVALAESIPGTEPGRTTRFGTDELAQILSIQPRNVRQVVGRLADRGIEIRVPLGKTSEGEPVFAYRGAVPMYQVPWFSAPDGCTCSVCFEGASQNAPSERKKGRSRTPLNPTEGASQDAPRGPEGAFQDAAYAQKGRSTTQKGRSETPPYQYQTSNQTNLDARDAPETTPAEAAPTTAEATAKRDARAQRNGALFTTQAKVSQPLQVILDTLADDNVTEDEARQVQSAWSATAKPRGLRLYEHVAVEGGIPWRTLLAELRTAAKAANVEKIAELKRLPRCPHGEPGGDQPHPRTGEALCVGCRRGMPAAETSGPQPVETYRRLYLAVHNERPAMNLMSAVAGQRHDLASKHGVDARALDALAAAAALNGHDLVTELRTQKERASA